MTTTPHYPHLTPTNGNHDHHTHTDHNLPNLRTSKFDPCSETKMEKPKDTQANGKEPHNCALFQQILNGLFFFSRSSLVLVSHVFLGSPTPEGITNDLLIGDSTVYLTPKKSNQQKQNKQTRKTDHHNYHKMLIPLLLNYCKNTF